jgi:hypothetical protein
LWVRAPRILMVFIDIAETISNHVLYPPFALKADLINGRMSDRAKDREQMAAILLPLLRPIQSGLF